MAELQLTYRAEVDYAYFEKWLMENFPSNYDGMRVDVEQEVVLFFFNELTSSEETSITTFYDGLTGSESLTSEELKIYQWIDVDEETDVYSVPKHVNYKYELNIRLHPVITDMVKGEVREIIYYESSVLQPDGTLLGTNPIVKETYVYTRDSVGFATDRSCTIEWYRNDESLHPEAKIRAKKYSSQDAIKEGVRRRTNITEALQLPVVGLLMQTESMTQEQAVIEGSTMMEDYELEIISFINTPKKLSFSNRLTADTTYTWLDNDIGGGITIRAYLLSELDLS